MGAVCRVPLRQWRIVDLVRELDRLQLSLRQLGRMSDAVARGEHANDEHQNHGRGDNQEDLYLVVPLQPDVIIAALGHEYGKAVERRKRCRGRQRDAERVDGAGRQATDHEVVQRWHSTRHVWHKVVVFVHEQRVLEPEYDIILKVGLQLDADPALSQFGQFKLMTAFKSKHQGQRGAVGLHRARTIVCD